MDDFNKQNEYGLSGEFADIYASVFGNAPVEQPAKDNPAKVQEEQAEPRQEYFPEEFREPPEDKYASYDFSRPDTDAPEEDIIDSRFKLGARRHSHYEYEGSIVNEGADSGYVPSSQPEYEELSSSYATGGDFDDFGEAEELEEEKPRKKFSLFGRKKKKAEENISDSSEDFGNYGYSPEESAAPKDEDFKDEFQDEEFPEDDIDLDEDYKPISFGQFVASRFTGLIFKVKGTVPEDATSATMMDESESLGPELSTQDASRYYGNQISFFKTRMLFAVLLVLCMVYISLGLPVPGMLQSLKIATCAVLALQLVLMLCCLDVGTNAVLNVFSGKMNIDFLAVLSCLITSVDAVLSFRDIVPAHMPLCAVSSVSLLGMMLASLLSTRGIRKALRVPAIAKSKYTVTGEHNIMKNGITLLKSTRPIGGFVRRTEEEPIDEENFRKYSPFLLITALAFTTLIIVLRKNLSSALYIFSMVFCPAIPFTALLCFALPYFTGSRRIFTNGAAIAGWSGTWDVGHSKNLIVTDRDLFPESCIKIESVRIFADYDAAKVISYAGAMVRASQSGLTPAFEKLMQENNCEPAELDTFEILSGGGLKSLIEGHIVICGNIDVMRLMNVRIPFRLVSKYSVLLSIDGVLYSIFNIEYTPDPKVRRALVSLMRSNRHPVFAVRDFNITPDMLHDCFDVATDGYDFPPYADRFPLSEATPSESSLIAAVICREGLGPLVAMADTGRSIYVTSRINTVISVASSIIWLLYSLIKLLIAGHVSLGFALAFMAAFSVPILLLGAVTSVAN